MMPSTIERIARAGRGEPASPSKPLSTGDFSLRGETVSISAHNADPAGSTPAPVPTLPYIGLFGRVQARAAAFADIASPSPRFRRSRHFDVKPVDAVASLGKRREAGPVLQSLEPVQERPHNFRGVTNPFGRLSALKAEFRLDPTRLAPVVAFNPLKSQTTLWAYPSQDRVGLHTEYLPILNFSPPADLLSLAQ